MVRRPVALKGRRARPVPRRPRRAAVPVAGRGVAAVAVASPEADACRMGIEIRAVY